MADARRLVSRRYLPPPRNWVRCAAEFQTGMRLLRIACSDDLGDDLHAMMAAGRARPHVSIPEAYDVLFSKVAGFYYEVPESLYGCIHVIQNIDHVPRAAIASRTFQIALRDAAEVIFAIELRAPDGVAWRLVAGDDLQLAHGVGSTRIEATIYFYCMTYHKIWFDFDRELTNDDVVISLHTLWCNQSTYQRLARTDVRQTFGDLELRYSGGVLLNA